MTVAADTAALNIISGRACVKTVDYSSDIQQTLSLTKIKTFYQISLHAVCKLLRNN